MQTVTSLHPKYALISECVCNRIVTPKEAAESFSDTVFEYFASQPDFVQERNSQAYVEHEPKTLADARKKKNILRRKAFSKQGTEEDRRNFRSAVKAVSFLKKRSERRKAEKTAAHQEDSYRKEFGNFSKQACNGNMNKSTTTLSFTKAKADEYFPGKYSHPVHIDFNKLQWFPYINVDEPNFKEFDLTPVTPKQVKLVLKAKKASSAPGPDGLMYGLMKNTPCVHHFLATLFSQLLLETHDPPESWSCCKVTLIHKGGDTNLPEHFRMISLTSCVSKVFHQILANRLVYYMTENRFIDPDVQKAFINGINGCVEHNQVLQEIISHSKAKKRTVHVTFFDLADAFGSVSHELISHSLRRFPVPGNLMIYIGNLYGRLQGSVKGNKWSSESFVFNKGVFQGDPLSPIIFLTCFNPLLEYLCQLKDTLGYDLNGTKVITTPYADDFNLITNNKIQHQKVIDKLNVYTSSMGLKLKPSKCCSLSVCGGVPKEIKYSIGSEAIRSIKDKPHKFLGSQICYSGKTAEVFDHVHAEILLKLKRIDELLIRPEYKAAIYSRYLLNSIRFLLTVHTLNKTHLDKLDVLTGKYLKNWLGIPSRGANLAIVHLPQGLNILRLSDIYRQSQTLAYSRSRAKADHVVNQAIDSTIERESQWSRKQSTVHS